MNGRIVPIGGRCRPHEPGKVSQCPLKRARGRRYWQPPSWLRLTVDNGQFVNDSATHDRESGFCGPTGKAGHGVLTSIPSAPVVMRALGRADRRDRLPPWRPGHRSPHFPSLRRSVSRMSASRLHLGGEVIGSAGPIRRLPDVFYRAACKSAAEISEKNLVKYNTRDEAVRDSKRPCAECRP
jgi:hypothetical protein